MNKLILTAATCLACITQVFAQKDPAALQILDAMSKKYQNIPAFTADFSYIMENDDEGIDEQFDGKITVKGDKYILMMSGQEILNDGTSVYTYSKDENEVTISEYYEEDDEISLSSIFTIYKTGYKFVLLPAQKNTAIDIVDLVPEDKEKDFYKIKMEIQKSNQELKNFRIYYKSGSKYLYRINSFAENTTIQEGDFRFNQKKYPGAEIVDFR